MYPMSTNLTTLGSRYSFIFDTGNKRLKHGVLGMFMERSDQLICGVEAEGIAGSYLPFSDKPNHFQAIYQSLDMNSVSFKAINKDGGYDMTVTFLSPFCPQEERMNVAPAFYVDIEIRNNTRPHNLVKPKKIITEGVLRFGLSGENVVVTGHDHYCDFQYDAETSSRFILGDFARTLNLKLYKDGEEIKTIPCMERISCMDGCCNEEGIFELPFKIPQNGTYSTSFLICGFCDSKDFISIYGVPHNLLYTRYFPNIEALTDYGWKNYEENHKKANFVSQCIKNSSLSQSWKDFISFTFQSYKLNTVYSADAQGNKAYHIWEGNCMYASTMDVEYNNGLFYYTFFPEVLPYLFRQWAASENGEGYIDHDLGEAYIIAKAKYSYPMIIEENCCYILMLHTYCIMQGSWDMARELYDVLLRLTERILQSDTTGNGIPNMGTDNTIDDAIPAIQNAKEQSYLAFKSACALQCFGRIAHGLGHEEDSRKAMDRSKKIIQSVDRELWRDDHYAVCSDTVQDGCRRFLTHEILSGPMEGRDSYSIYASNGLLYPFLCKMTPDHFNYDRIFKDICNAALKSATEYGCNHSHDSDSVWFSQNMWRDFTAAYLGVDMLDNVDRYWEFQKIMNTGEQLNLYIDTFGENALWYYPRGLTSVGVLYAVLGLQIDGFAKEVRLSPVRNYLHIPLVAFADWKQLRMPWVHVENGAIQIENMDLLKEYKIITE